MRTMPRTTLYVITLYLCSAPAARVADASTESTKNVKEEFQAVQELLNRGETAQALAALQRIPEAPPADAGPPTPAAPIPVQTMPAPSAPPPPTLEQVPPPERQRLPVERSLDDVLELMNEAANRISSVHYRKLRGRPDAASTPIEESWYQSRPAILKSHLAQDDHHVWLFVQDGQFKVFDPDRHLTVHEGALERESGWLMELGKLSAAFLRQQYELTLEKLAVPPAFLGSLYDDQPAPELYRLTGRPKQRDAESWPPVTKLEFVVDADRGLLVGLREFWRAGSDGEEERPATTDVVTHWASYPGSIVLPVAGTNEQLIEEPAGPPHLERTTWRIEVEELNTPLAHDTFDLPDHTE